MARFVVEVCMRRKGLVALAGLLAIFVSAGHAWAGEGSAPKQRSAPGYVAGLGGIWMLGADLKLGVGGRTSIETTFGLGGDRIFEDDSRIFHVVGADVVGELAKSSRISLTGHLGMWYLVGDTRPLEFLNFRGKSHSCGRLGLGSEAWNGYFVDLGYLVDLGDLGDISAVFLRAGYRFYP